MKGHVTITLASAISATMVIVGAVSQYYLYQNAQAQTIATQNQEIATTNNRITLVCNNYLDAISRIDQNMQNVAAALRVPTVRGNYNATICN